MVTMASDRSIILLVFMRAYYGKTVFAGKFCNVLVQPAILVSHVYRRIISLNPLHPANEICQYLQVKFRHKSDKKCHIFLKKKSDNCSICANLAISDLLILNINNLPSFYISGIQIAFYSGRS